MDELLWRALDTIKKRGARHDELSFPVVDGARRGPPPRTIGGNFAVNRMSGCRVGGC